MDEYLNNWQAKVIIIYFHQINQVKQVVNKRYYFKTFLIIQFLLKIWKYK